MDPTLFFFNIYFENSGVCPQTYISLRVSMRYNHLSLLKIYQFLKKISLSPYEMIKTFLQHIVG